MNEQVYNDLENQLDTNENILTVTPLMQAIEFHKIADAFATDKNYAKAEEYYLSEKEILEKLYNENPQDNFLYLINFYNDIGSFYQLIDKYREAEQYYVLAFNKVQEMNKQASNKYMNELATPLQNLGLLYFELEKVDKALEKINQAISLRESIPQKDAEINSSLAFSYKILGDINFHLQKLDETELNYLKSSEILRIAYPENKELIKPQLNNIYLDLADLYEKKGNQDEAKRYTELANQ